MKLYFNKYYN